MYPTDGGGPHGDETLDWLWDLEGYDVGAAGAGAPVEDVAAAAPTGVKKHLRKQPAPADDSAADEFATAAFALDPPTGPVGVPPVPEFTPATTLSPIVSPMDDEYVRRSRRPLMAAAVLLVIGLGTGVALAMSGGGGKHQVAQPAKVVVSPTTTTIPDTTVPGQPSTVPPPTDTTTVPATVVAGAASTTPTNTPPGTTAPVHRPGPTTPPGTTPATSPPTAPPTAPPTTHPATTAPPTTPTPTTAPPTTATTTPPTTATPPTTSTPPTT